MPKTTATRTPHRGHAPGEPRAADVVCAPIRAASAVASPVPVLRLDGLAKAFASPKGAVHAVRDIDLTVHAGETVALLGPNGAGKSTLIDMALGLIAPDSGTVSIVGRAPRAAAAAGLLGTMLQSSVSLVRDLSVREVVAMIAGLYPAPIPVAEALDLAGLGALADRRTQKLSGGEAQRLRFAVAIVGDPKLLVLDEPTAAMDVAGRQAFWSAIARLAADGATVIFATHYLAEAEAYADRAVLMAGGRIVASGAPTQIKARVAQRTIRATLERVSTEDLAQLPGVVSAVRHGDSIALRCADGDTALRALLLGYRGARDIEVAGADLEEAFVQLTRRAEPELMTEVAA